jgi:aspartyl-tRNA(Asn)/glutamyl-tRNA(Gln) amidotransferase subunit C
MKLTPNEVRHVAALARLGLSEQEVIRMGDQLSSILEHIAVLERVDTSTILPTAQVTTLANVMRDDVVAESLPRAAILANAPRQQDGFFEVDAILGSTADEELA